jgi:hypothetical protein
MDSAARSYPPRIGVAIQPTAEPRRARIAIMKKSLRIIGLSALLMTVSLVGVSVVARFSDGPIVMFAGGPLIEGELVTTPVTDWTFATEIDTVEFQLESPPRSRRVWILVHDGAAYVPCGLPNVRFLKQWPHEAMEDGRATFRIDGKRYRRHLLRITEPDLTATLGALASKKYGAPQSDDADSMWFFRLDPPREN